MGLAPYGNPARFRPAFQELYELLPRGEYIIRWDRVRASLFPHTAAKKGEPLSKYTKTSRHHYRKPSNRSPFT